jgi:hypothetical protein
MDVQISFAVFSVNHPNDGHAMVVNRVQVNTILAKQAGD